MVGLSKTSPAGSFGLISVSSRICGSTLIGKFYAIHSYSSSAGDPIDRLVHLRGLVCGLGEFCLAHKGEVGSLSVPNDLALDGQVECEAPRPQVHEHQAAAGATVRRHGVADYSLEFWGMRVRAVLGGL